MFKQTRCNSKETSKLRYQLRAIQVAMTKNAMIGSIKACHFILKYYRNSSLIAIKTIIKKKHLKIYFINNGIILN